MVLNPIHLLRVDDGVMIFVLDQIPLSMEYRELDELRSEPIQADIDDDEVEATQEELDARRKANIQALTSNR